MIIQRFKDSKIQKCNTEMVSLSKVVFNFQITEFSNFQIIPVFSL